MNIKVKYTLVLLAISAAGGHGALAQTLNISTGNITYKISASQAGLMEFASGETLTVQGKTYNLGDVSEMKVTDESFDDNLVEVTYDGDQAYVYVSGNIARYMEVDIDGAFVTVTQGSGIGDSTGEVVYVLHGESANGSFVLNGSYKCGLELEGLTLTNPKGAAIDIENGKRVELSAKKDFINTLVDGDGGKQKAALYCKGHLEFKGKGVLNVTGKTGHAIAAKEYIEMKNLTLNILGAPKDGINCTQYFLQESGNLNISGVEGDGVQVDYAEAVASARDKEDTGSITIQDGETNIIISGVAAKGLKSEGDFLMTGGKVVINSSSDGEWDSSKQKTKASACISPDGDALIKDGVMDLTASGGGGKGINVTGSLTIEGGNINITTSGGVLAYVNNKLEQNYTGNTDRLNSDYKSSPKGMKVDEEVIINGGTIYVKTTGNNGEGIESKGILTINGGDITVRAKDDGINASNDLIVNGGNLNIIATNNDGLDANGNIYINGGVVRSFGGAAPECGIDANDEQGYTVYLTGGYLLAVGGGNSYPRNSGSTQPYVTTSGAITGGNEISISGEGVDYTFTVPEDYTKPSGGNGGGWGPGGGNNGNMTIMISVPGMTNNTTYTVKNGTSTTTATSRLTGSSGGGRW